MSDVRRRRGSKGASDSGPTNPVVKCVRSRLPIINWLPTYNFTKLQADIIAGLTVGLMVVPQSIAYASTIAGLRPEMGLYSSWVGVMVYMFFGSSKDVTLGPTAIMSKITYEAADTKTYCLTSNTPECMDVTENAIRLALFGGVLNLMMGLFNMGFIIDFISLPVITGFTTSAALTIAWGQVHSLIGVKARRPFLDAVPDIFNHLHLARWPDVVMSIVCILMTIGLQKLKQKYDKTKGKSVLSSLLWFIGAAGNFFVVLLGIFVVMTVHHIDAGSICSKTVTSDCLTDSGHIPPGIQPILPITPIGKSNIAALATGAVLVALIGYLESVAIASAFARSNGYEVDTTQELLAIGMSNIVSFFFKSYPVTGSFSRTAVNSSTGVATPAAGLVTGAVVLVALAFLTKIMQYISKASLASIIIVSVLKMFDWRFPLKLWRVNKLDLIPWCVSFVGCTIWGIEYGVGAGAAINIFFMLYFTARPEHSVLIKERDSSVFRPLKDLCTDADHADGSIGYNDMGSSSVMIVKVGGSIFYPVGKSWKDFIRRSTRNSGCSAVVLDFSIASNVDYTGVQFVKQVMEDCALEHASVHFAEMPPRVVAMVRRAGIFKHFDKDPDAATQTVANAVAAAEADVLERANNKAVFRNQPAAPSNDESTHLLGKSGHIN